MAYPEGVAFIHSPFRVRLTGIESSGLTAKNRLQPWYGAQRLWRWNPSLKLELPYFIYSIPGATITNMSTVSRVSRSQI
jgi:hypothetical protein